MRISDWSSDVCSSDLIGGAGGRDAQFVEQIEHPPQADALAIFAPGIVGEIGRAARQDIGQDRRTARIIGLVRILGEVPGFEIEGQDQGEARAVGPAERRSEERRVWEECVRTCRYRWTPGQ